MSKKLMSLVLALVLVLTVGAAFAESSPSLSSPALDSPTMAGQSAVTNATIKIEAVVSSTGAALPADFLATIPQPADATEEEVAAAQSTLEAIDAFLTANGLPVVEYFGADVQAAIAEKLPADVAANDLVMRDFVALPLNDMAAAYDPSYGDITLQLEFPVDFAEGDTVVAVLGIIDPATGLTTWVVLDAVVNADGFVEITFTEEVFAQITEDSITTLAILA